MLEIIHSSRYQRATGSIENTKKCLIKFPFVGTIYQFMLNLTFLLSVFKKKKKFHPKGQDVEAQAASEQELTPIDPLRSAYRFILELREVGGGP